MSQHDRYKARSIVVPLMSECSSRNELIQAVATALEQEREAAAVKCDDIAKQHRDSLQLGATWNSAEECAAAIRETRES